MNKVKCRCCGKILDDEESDYCPTCEDELIPPPGELCEFCGDKEATEYLQDHLVCNDCYADAVESLFDD